MHISTPAGALALEPRRVCSPDAYGGAVDFRLALGKQNAGESCLAVLSISCSSPGTVLAHGSYPPLKLGAASVIGFALKITPLLPGFSGVLDAERRDSFAMHLPPGLSPAPAGRTIRVAAVALLAHGGFGAGSTAVEIRLDP